MDLPRMSLESLRAELLREPEHAFPCRPSECRDACTSPFDGPRWPPRPLLQYRLEVAREILVRAAYEEVIGRSCLASPTAARDYFRLHFAMLPYEVFLVAYLDAQNRVIAIEEAFRGTVMQTSVYPREIVRQALEHGATAIVACHQHPSGNATPSRADEVLTGAIKNALALVDVKLLDHLVFAAGEFASFAEKGLL